MKLLFTLLLLSVLTTAYAQIGRSFSLLEAKEYALKNNIKVINASLEYDVALQKKKEYLAAGMPEANINGTFNQFLNLPVQVLPISFFDPSAPDDEIIAFRAGTEFNSSANLEVNQLLFNGSYFIGIQASKLLIEVQNIQKYRTNEDVLFSVIEAYHIAAVAKENLIFSDSIFRLTESLKNTQQRYLDAGLLTNEDLDQMTYTVLSAKNAFENAELQFINTIAILKYAMGYSQDSTLTLGNSLSELDAKASQIALGSIDENSILPLLQTQIELAQCNVRNKKAGFLPSLSAYFQQSYNAYRTNFDFFQDKPWYSQTNWGLQMRIPVFSAGKGRSVVKQSEIQLLQDEYSYIMTKQGLKLQEVQLKNTIASALKKRALQKENSALAERIYRNAINKEKLGSGNNLLVTQKLNQTMIAQAQYTASLIEVYRSKLELDKLYNKLK